MINKHVLHYNPNLKINYTRSSFYTLGLCLFLVFLTQNLCAQSANTYGDGHTGGSTTGNKGNDNVHIGVNAGMSSNPSWNVSVGNNAGRINNKEWNVFIGGDAGKHNASGSGNVAIGYQNSYNGGNFNTSVGMLAGFKGGEFNTFIGANAGKNNTGKENVFLGTLTGSDASGSSNVFIGYKAGQNEGGSDLLYIDNSNTSSPLIWGDFHDNEVVINGDFDVQGAFTINGSPISGGASIWALDGNDIEYLDGNVAVGDNRNANDLTVWGDFNVKGNITQNGDPISGTSLWTHHGSHIKYTNGNVAIGDTDNTRDLKVWGDIDFTGNIRQNGRPITGGGASLWSQNGANISYTAGHVDIGNSSNANDLKVWGNFDVVGNLTLNGAPLPTGGGSSLWVQNGSDIAYTAGHVNIGADGTDKNLKVWGDFETENDIKGKKLDIKEDIKGKKLDIKEDIKGKKLDITESIKGKSLEIKEDGEIKGDLEVTGALTINGVNIVPGDVTGVSIWTKSDSQISYGGVTIDDSEVVDPFGETTILGRTNIEKANVIQKLGIGISDSEFGSLTSGLKLNGESHFTGDMILDGTASLNGNVDIGLDGLPKELSVWGALSTYGLGNFLGSLTVEGGMGVAGISGVAGGFIAGPDMHLLGEVMVGFPGEGVFDMFDNLVAGPFQGILPTSNSFKVHGSTNLFGTLVVNQLPGDPHVLQVNVAEDDRQVLIGQELHAAELVTHGNTYFKRTLEEGSILNPNVFEINTRDLEITAGNTHHATEFTLHGKMTTLGGEADIIVGDDLTITDDLTIGDKFFYDEGNETLYIGTSPPAETPASRTSTASALNKDVVTVSAAIEDISPTSVLAARDITTLNGDLITGNGNVIAGSVDVLSDEDFTFGPRNVVAGNITFEDGVTLTGSSNIYVGDLTDITLQEALLEGSAIIKNNVIVKEGGIEVIVGDIKVGIGDIEVIGGNIKGNNNIIAGDPNVLAFPNTVNKSIFAENKIIIGNPRYSNAFFNNTNNEQSLFAEGNIVAGSLNANTIASIQALVNPEGYIFAQNTILSEHTIIAKHDIRASGENDNAGNLTFGNLVAGNVRVPTGTTGSVIATHNVIALNDIGVTRRLILGNVTLPVLPPPAPGSLYASGNIEIAQDITTRRNMIVGTPTLIPANPGIGNIYAEGSINAFVIIAPAGRIGAITSKKIAVTPNPKTFKWPDYVFNDSFELMPLDDLEHYVKQEQHLPEVPSGADIAENGLDVANMDATLLKKIEELTLYTIQQNNQIKTQKVQLNEQQQKFTEQEKTLNEQKSELQAQAIRLKRLEALLLKKQDD